MSRDNRIVVDYDFKTLNWVYVVLSRVRTRNGLFLYHELDRSKIKQPDQALIKDNKRMMEIEQKYYIKENKVDSLTVIIQTNKHHFEYWKWNIMQICWSQNKTRKNIIYEKN